MTFLRVNLIQRTRTQFVHIENILFKIILETSLIFFTPDIVVHVFICHCSICVTQTRKMVNFERGREINLCHARGKNDKYERTPTRYRISNLSIVKLISLFYAGNEQIVFIELFN